MRKDSPGITLDIDSPWGEVFFFGDSHCPGSMLEFCCYNRIESHSYCWDGLKRGNDQFCIWQYTLSGFGRLTYNKVSYDLTPGTAMLVHVPHEHIYYLPPESKHWEFISLCFFGTEVERTCGLLERKLGPVIEFAPDSKSVETLVSIINSSMNGQIKDPYSAALLAYKMSLALIEDKLSLLSGAEETPVFMQAVIQHCLDHLDTPLSIDDLAEIAGYSRFHFSRLFKQFTNQSPASYLLDLRLNKAVRLLRIEQLSIKEVADRCGFQSANYFSKAFKHKFKRSPMDLRTGKC